MLNLAQRDQAVIWHPYTQMQTASPPLPIVKGEGALLYDEAGNTYIDAVSSWWVNTHGHCHPHIMQRINQQLQKLDHVIFAGFTHSPAVELAENLLQILPDNQKRIFYSDNGSTAVEVALKMAFQFWANQGFKKDKIIAFRESYHGDTFGAMSVSSRSAFTQPFFQYLFDVLFIDVPIPGKEEDCLKQLTEYSQRPDVAAFIFEPLVLGTAGMVMYKPKVLDELLQICKENQIITIADEVMTGFGRTGEYFASYYLQHQPDIFCLSKGLTGGTMALGVTSCAEFIYNAFLSQDKSKTFFHGHSFTANPIACATAIASLEVLLFPETKENINRIIAQHQAFSAIIKNHPFCKEVRQTGTIIAIEFETGLTSYFNNIRDVLYNLAMENQVLLRPLGNIIYVLPPYCISTEQLQIVYAVILKMADLLEQNKN
ncbi:adenosylmethionine--8-amino-7-oxononanoate transaminase [Adhaeribacter aquaticus]|uniref:adenosylmethionine--8-amino-7-oxononanoate transaminase n=1 Tax=Adhaeribacter aquaticus TaxID=299567 RepID=UPI00040979D1|nr:adenosylmethionine--8-amino-7-oxononanoate transaminase [Adhaeribacter aquaticus]